jgi:hypothetical protein
MNGKHVRYNARNTSCDGPLKRQSLDGWDGEAGFVMRQRARAERGRHFLPEQGISFELIENPTVQRK